LVELGVKKPEKNVEYVETVFATNHTVVTIQEDSNAILVNANLANFANSVDSLRKFVIVLRNCYGEIIKAWHSCFEWGYINQGSFLFCQDNKKISVYNGKISIEYE